MGQSQGTAQAWAGGVDDSGHPCLLCSQADPTFLVLWGPCLVHVQCPKWGWDVASWGAEWEAEKELFSPHGNQEDKAVPLVSLLEQTFLHPSQAWFWGPMEWGINKRLGRGG